MRHCRLHEGLDGGFSNARSTFDDVPMHDPAWIWPGWLHEGLDGGVNELLALRAHAARRCAVSASLSIEC